jgi:hypothetical protein
MNQICAKIYYLIATGEVLAVTAEMQGSVEPSTKERDMEVYDILKDKFIDEIDYIELEYGTLATTFNNAKSYSVNLSTRTFEVIKYTQEELDGQAQVIADKQVTESRINTISEYVNQNTSSIDDIENAIIQYELTNIENGVV